MKKKSNIFVGFALLLTGLGVLPIAFCHGQQSQSMFTHVTDATQFSGNPTGAVRDNSTTTYSMPGGNEATIQSIIAGKDKITTINNDSLQQGDISRQEREGFNNNNNNYGNNGGNNKPTNFGSRANNPAQTVRRCSPEANRVGIHHYSYSDTPPEDLASIGSRKIHREAKQPLLAMQDAARRDGVTLTVGSAYRSIGYQQGIVSRKENRGMSDRDIYSASAPAGYSEHSTGYAVDFSPINSSFGRSKAYDWLVNHAHEYGWEQSFTAQTAKQDNVMIEPWHWRYIGSDAARQLFNSPKVCP